MGVLKPAKERVYFNNFRPKDNEIIVTCFDCGHIQIMKKCNFLNSKEEEKIQKIKIKGYGVYHRVRKNDEREQRRR